MKREILFRGKRIDNGEWIEGDLLSKCKGSPKISINGEYNRGLFVVDSYEVIPETVGQWTGLTDKNGKKIFEGDRVLGDIGNGYEPVVRLLNRIGIVEYIDYAFRLKIINRFGINEKEKEDFCNTFVSLGAFGNTVIIGTKYDDCLYKTQDGHCIRESDNTVYAYCVEGPCDEIIGNKWEE